MAGGAVLARSAVVDRAGGAYGAGVERSSDGAPVRFGPRSPEAAVRPRRLALRAGPCCDQVRTAGFRVYFAMPELGGTFRPREPVPENP